MSPHRAAHRPRSGRVLTRVVAGALLVALLVVGGTAFRVWQVARADDRRPVDIAVVLGAAQYHGKPSDVLEARLNQALKLYRAGLVEYVVTVGGRQSGDAFTEAQAGKKWLGENGVPAERVVEVDVGEDTLGSMQAVADLAADRGWDSALIVSDPWHSLRARTMANDFGLESWTSPARSGPVVQTREFQFKYIARETAALLYYRLTHAPAELTGDGLG
ncbi:YdcF family protein [Saccharopolyspora sp. NPDC000359]|uniref:YdcF family protein n=1 Tax=Saccharopolyspora sp. NPDC000359 TaxID=3154251 RepID=UPI00331B474C